MRHGISHSRICFYIRFLIPGSICCERLPFICDGEVLCAGLLNLNINIAVFDA